MLVSYQWLKEYVDISDLTAEETAEKLTRGGVEVDLLHPRSEGLDHIVVGFVEECEQHPNADKLRICQVNTGSETAQIICGAPNVAAGQKVAVAKPGAVLPGGMKIKKAKLRGEASEGMICSLQELGIEQKLVAKEFMDGIYVFPEDAEVGADAVNELGLRDTVLELDLTPNRSDCLSMIGIAYEMAALLDRGVQLPDASFTAASESAANKVSVRVDVPEDNPYYSAKVIKEVTIGPSPLWMQNRLTAAGIRPINNVVDITNYVLIEYGQPLHAFDLDRFGSESIVVRRAQEEETITTLDEEVRTLSSEHMVITNGEEPTALAGVMGGAFSEVQEDTTAILLEAAYFTPARVRKTSKDTGLRSESSIRFEKGIDQNRVEEASARAAYLLERYAGGKVLDGTVEEDHRVQEKHVMTTDTNRVNQLLGMDITQDDIVSIFRRLRLHTEVDGENIAVEASTRRPDLRIEEDLIEEVARLYGYDYIPTTLPHGTTTPGGLSTEQKDRRTIRRFLETSGLHEAITYSLTSPDRVKRFLLSDVPGTVDVSLPMSEERSTMRTSLIPHLLDTVQYNRNRQINDTALFELGSVFIGEESSLSRQPEEKKVLAGAVTGLWDVHLWQGEKKKTDFFVVKGILEGLFKEVGIGDQALFAPSRHNDLHPGRSADVSINGRTFGFIGQVHPNVEKEWGIKETYVFQLDLDILLSADKEPTSYATLPRYPSISRDIALVVGEDVAAGEVKQVIEEAGGELLKQVTLFDVYEGENLEVGKKSLAFSLVYLDPERTLTDEEVTKTHEHVLAELTDKVQAVLRQ
ncbi:phenylalanyl-tRNA synthetase beta subunit [Alteribacillus persepolensis]|uniref:Phenylalanine--tRNA ligase beta subunit n=1 Tax=Alteribacillus persepolensis TaxID=568899 RepID=A0A1G8BNT7_9BACI|nr:phenylalanine--tRNA ligase subunit beta [Alteribacillus persepolensis]SDH34240.1 phenylalanyl-tRNA synthetase beta subunit [Alteribacillus persepolensis]